MKIERIEVFPLTSERPLLRIGQPIDPSWWGYDQTLVRVETDGGSRGGGQPVRDGSWRMRRARCSHRI